MEEWRRKFIEEGTCLTLPSTPARVTTWQGGGSQARGPFWRAQLWGWQVEVGRVFLGGPGTPAEGTWGSDGGGSKQGAK